MRKKSHHFFGTIIYFLMTMSLTSCVSGIDQALLQSVLTHWQQWQALDLRSYQYDYQRICFCPSEITQKVTITVSNGQISSIVNTASGASVTPAFKEQFLTVDGIYQLITQSLRSQVNRLTVEFDDLYAYPVNLYIDKDALIIDEEFTIMTANLIPL